MLTLLQSIQHSNGEPPSKNLKSLPIIETMRWAVVAFAFTGFGGVWVIPNLANEATCVISALNKSQISIIFMRNKM